MYKSKNFPNIFISGSGLSQYLDLDPFYFSRFGSGQIEPGSGQYEPGSGQSELESDQSEPGSGQS